jgi:hypothetical protein
MTKPRVSIVAAASVLALWSGEVNAGGNDQEPSYHEPTPEQTRGREREHDDRPFGRGTIVPRVGLGFGYSRDLFTLGWAAGGGYFVANGLEVGGIVSGTHLFWSSEMRAAYPGIQATLPNALIEITPLLRYVFFRNRWFSPYIFAGVGPTFFNNDAPVIGHWTTGPGFFIGLGRYAFLDISLRFSGRFPGGTCNNAFSGVFETAEGPVRLQVRSFCGFRWNPGIGVGFRF